MYGWLCDPEKLFARRGGGEAGKREETPAKNRRDGAQLKCALGAPVSMLHEVADAAAWGW